MRVAGIILLCLALILCAGGGSAEEEEGKDRREQYIKTEEGTLRIPPGMELKKVGDANILIPIGGKIFKAADIQIIESSGEYTSRKFIEIDARFDALDVALEEMRKEIKALKESIDDIERSKVLRSREKPQAGIEEQ